MRTYSAHFMNHADEIVGVNHFEVEHDDAAIKHASDTFPCALLNLMYRRRLLDNLSDGSVALLSLRPVLTDVSHQGSIRDRV